MKTPVSPTWIPGLVLVMAWLPMGLAQSVTNLPPTFGLDATLVIPVDILSQTAGLSDNPVPRKKPLPSKMRLSPWTTEIVKLAESRIEDDVMLTFIDNSGTFNLGADHIIYLSDLGVSSQIINAMLQHDQDLISGARMMTIASEPTSEPVLETIFVASSAASSKAITQPASAPASPVPVAAASVTTSNGESLPTVNRVALDAQPAALQYAMADELESVRPPLLTHQWQSPEKKRSLYPVREPYPVELTAPIILITAEDRTPNTLIIVGFPRSTP